MGTQCIFDIQSDDEFELLALKTFEEQYQEVPVYKEFCDFLGKQPGKVTVRQDIPFLPIDLFRNKQVLKSGRQAQTVFSSSGTTTSSLSYHYVADLNLYRQSFIRGFEFFYGPPSDYCMLALLPSYQERPGSSLIYMVAHLISLSGHPLSAFVDHDAAKLYKILDLLESKGTRILLLGVSFALLDLALNNPRPLKNTIVMETGGMKGRRKEIIREELHGILRKGFSVDQIHSEYGMTELLSQAYSKGDGRFQCPPWMRVDIRDTEDPLTYLGYGRTGGINITDLANQNSCAFLSTQDLGRIYQDGRFEVLGRFDHSDIRGCNLMAIRTP